MKNTAPHYLLITEAKTIIDSREGNHATPRRSGQWRFVLEQMGVEARIEVADAEPNVFGERLELLAVVRGLESLEQPSRVTLLTSSRYVGRGIRQGMNQWRSNQWRWERFGAMTLVKNHDLWRRVDQTLQFHSLECRILDLGRLTAHANAASKHASEQSDRSAYADRSTGSPQARVDSRHRRSNVIRPHGDHFATTRKPIEPQEFSIPSSPRKTTQTIKLVDKASALIEPKQAAVRSVEPVASPCENDQRAECTHTVETMARVKPPRAGRAYGYAVN